METRRTPKRKLASGNQKGATRFKKLVTASLRDSNKLTKALEYDDFLAVEDMLVNKKLEFDEETLNASLLKAVNEGKRRMVQMLLDQGACADRDSKTASSALLAAIEYRHIDIVKELISKDISVDIQDAQGKTPLMLAVEKSGCSALVSCLLENGNADVDTQDNEGKTALMLAVERWDFEVAKMLYDSCCKDDVKDNRGQTAFDLAQNNGFARMLNVLKVSRDSGYPPLYEAAKTNNVDLVHQLLEVYPSCIFDYPSGESPLVRVMHGEEFEWDGNMHCSFEIMEALLKAGLSPNAAHCISDLSTLMYAACTGSEKMVQVLIHHEANLNERSSQGRTALWMAANKGHASVVNLLISNGARTLLEDQNGDTELEAAIKGGNKACIKLLLPRVWRINPVIIDLMLNHKVLDALRDVQESWHRLLPINCDNDPLFPQFLHMILFQAIQIKSYPLVKDLLKYGIDVNWCYTYGVDEIVNIVQRLGEEDYGESVCPLFFALSLNDDELLQILLEGGADVNIRHKSTGYTALMHASVHGDLKSVHLLLKLKADMYAEKDGHTALSLACKKGQDEVVSALLDAGMDVNHLSQTKVIALWYSLMRDYNARTIKLLFEHGANINFANTNEVTILMKSLEMCPVGILELILKNGADVSMQDGEGNTALFYALGVYPQLMISQKQEKVSLLLQYGANVNHINFSLRTPLMVAAERYPEDLLQTLLAYGPVLNAQDNQGNTALHIAVEHSKQTNLKTLISNGADMNIFNGEYRNPLMIAVHNFNPSMVRAMLELGASVSFQDSADVRQKWQIDLDSLFQSQRVERRHRFYEGERCLKYLLQAGCSLDEVQTSKLDLFFCSCIRHGKVDLVQLILESGVGPKFFDLNGWPEAFSLEFIVDIDAFGNRGISPMCAAIFFERIEIINLFSETCFYHPGDVKMLQHPRIQCKLEALVQDSYFNDSSLLEELCPENWSLLTWSKLAVLRAVGYGEGREQRVRVLPIPQRMHDELLYKNITRPVSLGGSPDRGSEFSE